MTGLEPRDERLLALLAVFAPGRAVPLLARLGGAGAEAVQREGLRHAAAARRERLATLARAMGGDAIAAHRGDEPLRSLCAAERPRVVAALVALAKSGTTALLPRGVRPALARWVRIRLAVSR